MVLKAILLLFLCWNTPMMANMEYGEHRMPLYFGRVAPYGHLDSFTNLFQFQEYIDRENFVINYTQSELLETQGFFEKIIQNFQCTDKDFSYHKNYMKYLFEIATLSYLDKTLQEFENTAQQIGWGKVCNYNLTNLLERCKPQSKYMNFFVESSSYLSKKRKKFILKYDVIPSQQRDKWFSSFRDDYDQDLTKLNLTRNCGEKCSAVNREDFSNLCQSTKQFFLNICNEKDQLYGMDRVPEIYLSLIYSQALREMDKEVYNFKGCLRRFSHYFKEDESISINLRETLRNVYYFSKEEENPLGELFDVSSLKSFLELGADSLFDKPIKSEELIVKKQKTKEKMPQLKEEIKQEVDTVLKKIRIENKKKIILKKEKPQKRKYSYFYESFQNMMKLNFDSFILDMSRFKVDYSFSPKVRRILDTKMKEFSKRKTLEEMLEFDKLGSLKSPVPVLFIKYLIDTENHTGLFNITSVLGETFYLLNDIDSLEKPMIIKSQLSFDSNENQWQIYFINTKEL